MDRVGSTSYLISSPNSSLQRTRPHVMARAGRPPIHRTPHAYPVYDLTYRENLDALLGYLDSFENFKTAGRQGLFKYNNMDHSIEMGLEMARSFLTGEKRDHRLIASEEKYFG